MYFLTSKTIGFFAVPSNFILTLANMRFALMANTIFAKLNPRDGELESGSRNTRENAINTMHLSKPGERWVLIMSASRMPRAIGLFRKAGFRVEAYPVDWHTVGWSALTAQSLSFLMDCANLI